MRQAVGSIILTVQNIFWEDEQVRILQAGMVSSDLLLLYQSGMSTHSQKQQWQFGEIEFLKHDQYHQIWRYLRHKIVFRRVRKDCCRETQHMEAAPWRIWMGHTVITIVARSDLLKSAHISPGAPDRLQSKAKWSSHPTAQLPCRRDLYAPESAVFHCRWGICDPRQQKLLLPCLQGVF